jgi:predicted nucleic acid-binding protein
VTAAIKVVDASALAALLFGEPEADAIAERLADARLVAPSLLAFELANVCLIKACRHPELREALMAAFRLRRWLGIEEAAVDLDQALEVATETGLTAYEASYLWLAGELAAELVTLDRALETAARQR